MVIGTIYIQYMARDPCLQWKEPSCVIGASLIGSHGLRKLHYFAKAAKSDSKGFFSSLFLIF